MLIKLAIQTFFNTVKLLNIVSLFEGHIKEVFYQPTITIIHPFSSMQGFFLSPFYKINRDFCGDSLQLDVYQTAHVVVTWCGLGLLIFNPEKVKQPKDKRHFKIQKLLHYDIIRGQTGIIILAGSSSLIVLTVSKQMFVHRRPHGDHLLICDMLYQTWTKTCQCASFD